MKHSNKLRDILSRLGDLLLSPSLWLWLFPVLILMPNIGLSITEYNSLWAKLTNIFLPLGIYYFLISLSKKVGRTMLYFFPVMFFGAFQIVLLFLYGESIIAIDMYTNVLTTSFSEATELLDNLKVAIIVVLLLYLPAIISGIAMIVKRRYATPSSLHVVRRASYGLIVIGILLFAISELAVTGFNPRREMFPYNVIENLGTAIKRTNESMHYHTTSETFSYRPVATRDKEEKEVFVFVIGETSRAGNWELFGYDRQTNPRLSKRSNLIRFGKAVTEINTTHKAVPMLLSYLTPEIFGDSVAHTKSVFSAFNALGYRTAFISNQRRNHSYIDFYGGEAQKCEFLTDNGGPQEDMNLIPAMKEILENSSNNKLFIVLHTYGSHFEYKKRYPAGMAHFTPDNNSAASVSNRRDLINAYDNTIRYTDSLLDSVIATLDSLNVSSSMVYVSDHGEDIFDDARERFLHSSPTPTFYQIHVPMLIWMSDEFIDRHPGMYRNALSNSAKNISSTRSVFHTLLELAGIRSSYFDSSNSVVSRQYSESPRKYLNDYNESVPLSESGLRDLDFEAFKKSGINFK